ncbi:MAG: hypothetical protein OXR68_08355 [Alphaproteobacteria bacterium]|nr:hypothetical protein [Alphaproteobacteria bacterium]MDD9920617.1 hypothetical protein [Alphaproteobacteria bacterium]
MHHTLKFAVLSIAILLGACSTMCHEDESAALTPMSTLENS